MFIFNSFHSNNVIEELMIAIKSTSLSNNIIIVAPTLCMPGCQQKANLLNVVLNLHNLPSNNFFSVFHCSHKISR